MVWLLALRAFSSSHGEPDIHPRPHADVTGCEVFTCFDPWELEEWGVAPRHYVFHHSELTQLSRPEVPRVSQRCIAFILFDEAGVPTDVQADDCPEEEAAEAAIATWRWAPVVDWGTCHAILGQTAVAVMP